MKTNLCFALLTLPLAFFLSPSAFPQGALTPPGAPAPTMKTLDQIEARTPIPGGTAPFTISQPGSYYLTGNLSISGGNNNGITVSASSVTIDLNGFALAGSGATSGTGILIGGGIANVTIRNGTIRNWGAHGINGAGNSKVRAENLRVFGNSGNGILVDVNGEVLNCVAESNVGAGIKGLDNCLVKDSQAISTTGTNAPGISFGAGAVVTGCVASGNSGNGITVGNVCKIENCTVLSNTGDGVHGGVVVEVSGCVAASNANGINLGDHALVSDCHTNGNTAGGVLVADFSIVRGCTADFNGSGGAPGINVIGSGNRIEANNVTRNSEGIRVSGSGNLVIRNSARGNTINYINASGNDVGPIGSAATSTSSWTNIAY
jgi:parallel beta-helix repeat protein